MDEQQHRELVTEVVAFSKEMGALWHWFARRRLQDFTDSKDSRGAKSHLYNLQRFHAYVQRKFEKAYWSLEHRYVNPQQKTKLLPFADKRVYEEGFDSITDNIKNHPSWHEETT